MQFQNCVFLLALLITISKAMTRVTDTSFDKVEPGKNIMGKVGAERTARSKIQCSSMCLSDDACLGYQYQQKRNEPGKCVLIHKSCTDNFQSVEGAVVYERHLLITAFSKKSNETWKTPSEWTGPRAVLHYSFDNSDGFDLMEGSETTLTSIPLVAGKVNCAWTLNRTKSQWVDLGIHTEACMTRPETCGTAGGAISLWVKDIFCSSAQGGIVSSYGSSTGSLIYCLTDTIRFYVHVTDGYFLAISSMSDWTHVVLNYIGPDDGQGIRIYYDGIEVSNDTTKYSHSLSAGDGRIVVGRSNINIDDYYASVQMDELIYFNRTLTSAEIQSIYNSV